MSSGSAKFRIKEPLTKSGSQRLFLLFRQHLHDFVAARYKFGHLVGRELFVAQNCQVIKLFADDRCILCVSVFKQVLYQLVVGI